MVHTVFAGSSKHSPANGYKLWGPLPGCHTLTVRSRTSLRHWTEIPTRKFMARNHKTSVVVEILKKFDVHVLKGDTLKRKAPKISPIAYEMINPMGPKIEPMPQKHIGRTSMVPYSSAGTGTNIPSFLQNSNPAPSTPSTPLSTKNIAINSI